MTTRLAVSAPPCPCCVLDHPDEACICDGRNCRHPESPTHMAHAVNLLADAALLVRSGCPGIADARHAAAVVFVLEAAMADFVRCERFNSDNPTARGRDCAHPVVLAAAALELARAILDGAA